MSIELIFVIVVVLLALGIAALRKVRTGSSDPGGGEAKAGMRKSPGRWQGRRL